jgi:hypothetical protein
MPKTTLAVKAPTFFTPPTFVGQIMEAVRENAKDDSVIRVRMDNSAKSVVSFTAQWIDARNRTIHRRVYVETKLDENGCYSLVYMAKVFDENAVNRAYTNIPDSVEKIAKDIMRYLRMGHLPQE